MAQYALLARSEVSRQTKMILDVHNALYRIPRQLCASEPRLWRRWLLRREAQALERYEKEVYGRFDQLVFVTDVDRSALGLAEPAAAGRGLQQARLTTIPICVDTEEHGPLRRKPSPGSVVHLGTMLWPPNVEGVLWFARKVWPLVAEQVPRARYTVIGKEPPAKIRSLADVWPNVHVTGYVEHPTPYLEDAAVFIVPLLSGGGMRVKILEAWRLGLPVVSTSIGAEGIDAHDGEHLLLADGAEAFAQAVVRLLNDPMVGSHLGSRGRSWVEKKYDWRQVYTLWDDVYNAVLSA
jgi:glycosyltransferase involved in cell wall biosynthesis